LAGIGVRLWILGTTPPKKRPRGMLGRRNCADLMNEIHGSSTSSSSHVPAPAPIPKSTLAVFRPPSHLRPLFIPEGRRDWLDTRRGYVVPEGGEPEDQHSLPSVGGNTEEGAPYLRLLPCALLHT
jgi:hypothetical protein